jgi:phosphoribosylaminoimidazolecarboxamide formyltransferase/IMP cyclohydrolase
MKEPSVKAADLQKVRRALISVSDKTGIAEFGADLAERGIELISTGGSAKTLRNAGLNVTDVADVTGFPEMMDGRVKTLHPMIHGGLLALRDDPGHARSMSDHEIRGVDLLVVNLYPFEETIAKGASYALAVENIDIGGPALIRAGAKNHGYVAVATHSDDYQTLLEELDANDGATTLALRQELAARAYTRTAAYDTAISNWFADELDQSAPPHHRIDGELKQTLRYGENPHQTAGFYCTDDDRPGVATAEQLQGKELSYNNINDTDSAYELVAEFDPEETAAVAIIKHANPCGVACGATLTEAYQKALRCDPVSAFGGVIATNRLLDPQAAQEITKIFTEVVIAPEVSNDARATFAKKKNLRLLAARGLPDPLAEGWTFKSVAGGFLAQSRDNGGLTEEELRIVTKRAPTDREIQDLMFAFTVAKHVKSNTIVYAKDRASVGIGAGQMSRVDSARIAAQKSLEAAREAGSGEPLTRGSVAASDAFFPFADGLLTVVEAGATAVIQPGGSIRDDEVIAAADDAGIAMVFTGMRHFRH